MHPLTFISNLNANLCSHSNTQERKPVTNSRDTQELLPDAGHEMLRIFLTHPARTSLLQDFAYYEVCISLFLALFYFRFGSLTAF